MYPCGQSSAQNHRKRGDSYRGFGLIGGHVVLVWSHLPEQSLLYETDVLSISRVIPVVDQAPPDGASFPQGV